MPRVKTFKSNEQLAIEEELRSRCGGMMTVTQVMGELGYAEGSRRSVTKWLEDVPGVRINGLKKYRVGDVAAKIYRGMEAAV